jgi:CheY-like chemotaxis protein
VFDPQAKEGEVNILVGEHDESFREALIDWLQSWDHIVTGVEDMQSVLQKLAGRESGELPCDLLILDSEMPGIINGHEGYIVIRNNICYDSLPAILLCGDCNSDLLKKSGPRDVYMRKNDPSFFAKLEKHLKSVIV